MKSFLLLAIVAMIPAIVLSQSPPTLSIEGFVRRSDTAAPIEGAMIQLTLVPGGLLSTVTTDRAGHFIVSNLTAGNYTVTTRKDGYFGLVSNRTPGASQYAAGLYSPVQLTAASRSLELTLAPGGALRGQILDASGLPVAQALPELLEVIDGQPPRRLGGHSPQETDDTGAYRVFGIQPGKHYLSVRVRRSASEIIYFPGTRDLALATLIEIRPGVEASADLKLPQAGRSVISGNVTPRSGTTQSTIPLQVFLIPRDVPVVPNQIFTASPNLARNPAMDFEVRDVSPGQYDLYAYAVGPRPVAGAQAPVYGPTRVEVRNANISGIAVPFHPSVEVRGKLVDQNGAVPRLSGGMRVRLEPTELPVPGFLRLATVLNSDGSFAFPSVPLGEYHLRADSFGSTVELRTPSQSSEKDILVVDGPTASPVEAIVKPASR